MTSKRRQAPVRVTRDKKRPLGAKKQRQRSQSPVLRVPHDRRAKQCQRSESPHDSDQSDWVQSTENITDSDEHTLRKSRHASTPIIASPSSQTSQTSLNLSSVPSSSQSSTCAPKRRLSNADYCKAQRTKKAQDKDYMTQLNDHRRLNLKARIALAKSDDASLEVKAWYKHYKESAK